MYNTSIFGDFYWGDAMYGSSTDAYDVPKDLKFFRTNIDGKYVFHWTFDPEYISPLLSSLNWNLEIDDNIDFTSPVLFDKITAENFQNGNVAKGYDIIVEPRAYKSEPIYYARVQTVGGSNTSVWSIIKDFNIFKQFQEESAENLLTYLPDEHVYNKDILNQAIIDRKTNLFSIVFRMYGKALDEIKLEVLLTTFIFAYSKT